MRYNHLLALPLIATLLASASGFAMANTSNTVTGQPAKLGFVAASVAQTVTPSYARLAMDDSLGSFDKRGRVERAERDRVDHQRPDRPDRPERPHR